MLFIFVSKSSGNTFNLNQMFSEEKQYYRNFLVILANISTDVLGHPQDSNSLYDLRWKCSSSPDNNSLHCIIT